MLQKEINMEIGQSSHGVDRRLVTLDGVGRWEIGEKDSLRR